MILAKSSSNAAELVTLTAAYPAFQNPNGQLVATLVVSPGAAVRMQGVGPVTATPSADPTLAVMEKFGPFTGSTSACFPELLFLYEILVYGLGPDPVDTTVLQAVAGKDRQSTAWINRADGDQASSYLLLTGGDGAAAPSTAVQVRALGASDLRSTTRGQAFALTREERGAKHVRLVGANFSISAPSAPTAVVWRTPALMSFPIPNGADPGRYRILHLAPSAGAWIETQSIVVSTDGRSSVRAYVSNAGIYAFARLEP